MMRDMASNEETQELEILSLKSIYPDLFFDNVSSNAWKGAPHLPEFGIRINHEHSDKFVVLNVKFPKSYPTKSTPFLSIVKQKDFTTEQITKLLTEMRAEAQRCLGSESIFSVIDVAQNWMRKEFSKSGNPAKEDGGISLALEMQNRALEEEKARIAREESAARAEHEKESLLAQRLAQQLERDSIRKEELRREEKEKQKARKRALSDVTEKPVIETSVEMLDEEVEVYGVRFDSVRLFHGKRDCFGMTYSAEPICDELPEPVALDLHVVTFHAGYYKTQLGRKKIDQIENELRRLTKLPDYSHIHRVLSVQSNNSKPTQTPRLTILMEKKPSFTLQDLLQDCDGLREDRTKLYLIQICKGLRIIHEAGLVHRGERYCYKLGYNLILRLVPRFLPAINPSTIGLVDSPSEGRVVKLIKPAFAIKLRDMHRSEPFSPGLEGEVVDHTLPEDWIFSEAVESPLTYTRCRDMHSVGVVVLQMIMGLDVPDRYPSPALALPESGLSLEMNSVISDVLKLTKRPIASASDVIQKLERRSISITPRAIPIVSNGSPTQRLSVATPVARITFPNGSPQKSYFLGPEGRLRKASRWRDDWEQLDVLGKGGFGQVVKARNLIDGGIYAVKKIKLRTAQADSKIFREVNALSRLNHRFIVRYYTTWLEESEPTSSSASSDSGASSSGNMDDQTAGAYSSNTPSFENFNDPRSIDLKELMKQDDHQNNEFPSIHFTSGDVLDDDSEDEDEATNSWQVDSLKNGKQNNIFAPPLITRTLYIQMEYVERQTLKELIDEGISEDKAWHLFQQIVDALVHMAGLGILHRDIKLTNIFIDSEKNCKVGDFGLATSSLAAVDPSDVSPMSVNAFSDFTLDVGTRLYIAPEILSKRGGRDKDHSKADLYSLGIVFFEMNYTFNTASERIFVIENLRHPEITFPGDWDTNRPKQKQVIQWLLQHDPSRRPTAIQLSQSPLLPARVEDEYFKAALNVMTSEKSQYYPAVLASLFSRAPEPTGEFLYDYNFPETAILRDGVIEQLRNLFHLHGARDVDVPLLMPLTDKHLETSRQVLLLDTRGEIVALPSNALLPFARLAARHKTTRIKRYHIGDTFRMGEPLAHPFVSTAAICDVITPDVIDGPNAASAEMLTLIDECLGLFPNLARTYEVRVSHSKIAEAVIGRVPEKFRETVFDILQENQPAVQKRAILQRKGLSKLLIDELEIVSEDYEDFNVPLLRLEKHSSMLATTVKPYLQAIHKAITLASPLMNSIIRVQPLMIGKRHDPFKGGVCFEVVNPRKRADILAVGGRYDHLINQFYMPSVGAKREPFVAVGIQIAMERITSAIAAFQKSFLELNTRQYDRWHARRCDVYIVSFQAGYLSVRYEIASLLWRYGISADLMYETGVSDTDMEGLANRCYNEGILFTLYPKVKAGQREALEFKVKSILRGTEYEVNKQELVPWLQHQIAEQKKIDQNSSGVNGTLVDLPSSITAMSISRESSNQNDLQVIVPGDGTSMKKQRKLTKQIFFDRAYEKRQQIKAAIQSGSVPSIAIDASPVILDALVKSNAWVYNDEAWRGILQLFPAQHTGFANQIRDAVVRRRNEGAEYILIQAVKEERILLLNLKGSAMDH